MTGNHVSACGPTQEQAQWANQDAQIRLSEWTSRFDYGMITYGLAEVDWGHAQLTSEQKRRLSEH